MKFLSADSVCALDPFASFLTTPEANALLESIDSVQGDRLKMRANHPFLPNLLQLWHRRRDHADRFTQARQMLFTAIGAEQATGEAIADYKAGWACGAKRILVACSGIGGELMSLMKRHPDAEIIAVDLSLEALAAAAWNARLLGAGRVRFVHASLEEFLTVLEAEPLHFDHCYFDPDRRKSGKKRVALEDYMPLPEDVLPKLEHFCAQVHMKVSPMLRFDNLEPVHLTWISEGMTLKECVVHYGHGSWPQAVHLENGPHIWPIDHADEEQDSTRDLQISIKTLLELSPSLLRAGSVEEIMHLLGAAQVHPDSSLLLLEAGHKIPHAISAFFRIFEILEEFPYAPDLIKNALADRHITRLVIKKRFFPMEPQAIRKQLRLAEGGEYVLFCTTKPPQARVAFLCRRLQDTTTFSQL